MRSEEWVNALPYDDPAPTEADLALRTETGMAPALDDGTQEVRVAVTARELAAWDRPSVNLTLVVDRSGSMDIRTRLGLVKSSIALLAESLRPDDTVSVVAFDDTVDAGAAARPASTSGAPSWPPSTACSPAAAPTWPTACGWATSRPGRRTVPAASTSSCSAPTASPTSA